jgi:hypothetical protein
MDNHGICSARHPPAHRPLANAACLVSEWNPHLTRLSSHTKRVRYGVGIPVCLAKYVLDSYRTVLVQLSKIEQ